MLSFLFNFYSEFVKTLHQILTRRRYTWILLMCFLLDAFIFAHEFPTSRVLRNSLIRCCLKEKSQIHANGINDIFLHSSNAKQCSRSAEKFSACSRILSTILLEAKLSSNPDCTLQNIRVHRKFWYAISSPSDILFVVLLGAIIDDFASSTHQSLKIYTSWSEWLLRQYYMRQNPGPCN